jgi:DnaK suppressor protein
MAKKKKQEKGLKSANKKASEKPIAKKSSKKSGSKSTKKSEIEKKPISSKRSSKEKNKAQKKDKTRKIKTPTNKKKKTVDTKIKTTSDKPKTEKNTKASQYNTQTIQTSIPTSKQPDSAKQQTATNRNKNKDFNLIEEVLTELNLKSTHSPAFIAKQKAKLEELRDTLLDQMADVAHDSLRAASENGGGAAFGQHMGDAGSEAYERDFALSLLSQEQDSLYEINEALRRIEMGTYGMCEKSGKPIPKERLEAIPWARYTVECQKSLEKTNPRRNRWESTPQFMDSLESEEETEEEDSDDESRLKNKE